MGLLWTCKTTRSVLIGQFTTFVHKCCNKYPPDILIFIIVSPTGRDGALPLCRSRLLWYSQTPPPSRRQPRAARSQRTSSDRHGQRRHASPGHGAPPGSPDPERARSRGVDQWHDVGGARSDVLAMGRITRPAWKKRLLLWDHSASRYDPASTKVRFQIAVEEQYATSTLLLFQSNVVMTFLSCQWLVDEPRAVPCPSELAATAQPISNSAGPSKNHGPLASANQHLTGGDLGRRGPRQAPGSPQSCDTALPVAAARPPAALLLLHPACIAASVQQPPARA